MRNVTKTYPGVLALDSVSFDLRAGEVHALAGENGSGKSTLVKILYGAIQPDAGTLEFDGKPVQFTSPRQALEQGIVAISQELTLARTLTVTENVLMGRLPRRLGMIDWGRAYRRAREVLDELSVHVDVTARVGSLSIEIQQEVEIARAVSADSRVIVLDEATSSLSDAATERLLARVADLSARGVAIVYVSHRMRELYQCASRVTVLRDGRLVGTEPLSQMSQRGLVRMMVGREIEDLYKKRSLDSGGVALDVRNLSTADGSVVDVSFSVRQGEIVGIAGLVGCGKTELGLAIAGADKAEGEVIINGRTASVRNPAAALDAGIGFTPEDRRHQALLPTRSVQENLVVAWMMLLSRLGFVKVKEERTWAWRTVSRFRIVTPSLATRVMQLSGGNQQKVILGRCFARSPKVLVLAEPTRGIDVGAKAEVYSYMQEMAEEGAAILLTSSELPELLGISDRILVMYRGRICAEFDARSATEEQIAHEAVGAGDMAGQIAGEAE